MLCVLGHVQFFVATWIVALQSPLSVEVSRQEYWSGCHFLLQGIFLSRNQTHVSCISRQILYHCTIWEAPLVLLPID